MGTIKDNLNILTPPVQSWQHPVFEKATIQVDVLRLDLIHPVIGGNKWMKLRGFLQKAVGDNKMGILTKGGPWSNHVHACAWACYGLQLPFYVWVKGHQKQQTAMLQDIQNWNAQISFVNRTQFYDESEAIEFAATNNLQYIPMGGADKTGVQEVTRFLETLHLAHYNYAMCAVGTATSFGGLAFVKDNFETIIGIEAGTNDIQVAATIGEWQRQLPHRKLILLAGYRFGGFARYTPALVSFANALFTSSGIPSDIVYTSKLLYAVQDLAAKNYFEPGATVLVLHSGGLQGNRSLPSGLLQF